MLGWGFRQDLISFSHTHLNVVLLSLVVGGAIQVVFSPFSVSIIPYVAINLVCPCEEVSSGSPFVSMLAPVPMVICKGQEESVKRALPLQQTDYKPICLKETTIRT